MVSDDFYHAFEDKFRGSREDIKRRQTAYIPLIDAVVAKIDKAGLDIGCGRAEWLELLTENGVRVKGVDMNADFVALGKERGLDIVVGEANAYLESLPDESLSFISAFHVVEHLGFEVLLRFIENACRVLDKDGVLILETPNPSNLSVGANTFYMDPTHERPLPPGLLSFATEYAGFEEAIILPMNKDLLPSQLQKLSEGVPGSAAVNELVVAVSEALMSAPDYASIGIKSKDSALGDVVRGLFTDRQIPLTNDIAFDVPELLKSVDLGLRNADIAHSAAEHANSEVQRISHLLMELSLELKRYSEESTEQIKRCSEESAEQIKRCSQESAEQIKHLDEQMKALLDRMNTLDQKLRQVESPGGWGIADSLRKLVRFMSNQPAWRVRIRRVIAFVVIRAVRGLNALPKVKKHVSILVARHPVLKAKLLRLIGRNSNTAIPYGTPLTVEKASLLSTQARDIYLALLATRKDSADDSIPPTSNEKQG